jgi:hypothetical protein
MGQNLARLRMHQNWSFLNKLVVFKLVSLQPDWKVAFYLVTARFVNLNNNL